MHTLANDHAHDNLPNTLAAWRAECQAREQSAADTDFSAWVAGAAALFDALGHEAGHVVAYHLRDLAAEARFLGLGDPISPAEYVNRRDTQLGWLQQS